MSPLKSRDEGRGEPDLRLDEHHGHNAALVRLLVAQARPGEQLVGPDGCELHTHPDLGERFRDVVRGEGRVTERWGAPIAVDARGIAFAYALGMRAIWFRLDAAPDDLELRQDAGPREQRVPGAPRAAATTRGRRAVPQWFAVSPWQSDVPTAEGLRRLAQTAHEARLVTADLP